MKIGARTLDLWLDKPFGTKFSKTNFRPDPVKIRMTFVQFFISCFQNLIFCEILWVKPRKKITRQK